MTFYAITAAMTVIALGLVLPSLAGRAPVAAGAGRGLRRGSLRPVATVALLLPVLAYGIYVRLGEPGAVTSDSAATMRATIEGAASPQFIEDLARHLDRNAHDARGWVLLGRAQFSADRPAEAAAAYEKALGMADKVAGDPGVWCEYADALAMAQGGSLAGKPRDLIAHALALDPGHGKALEMAGSAAFEAGEFATAAEYWRTLMSLLPAGDPMRRDLDGAITRADLMAISR